jgi:hypothetical protein
MALEQLVMPYVPAALFLGGLAWVLTWIVTLYEVALYLEAFSCPPQQRHVIQESPPVCAPSSRLCRCLHTSRTTLEQSPTPF